MRITRRLLSFGLVAATSLALALPSNGASHPTNPNCKHGPTHGGFKLPSGGNPGEMKGVLADPSGNTVLRIVAKLSPPSPGNPGKILGALIKHTPNGPEKVADVHGQWKPGSMMGGEFRVVFTVSTPAGPKKVGKAKGGYKNGSAGNGMFKGKWILCK